MWHIKSGDIIPWKHKVSDDIKIFELFDYKNVVTSKCIAIFQHEFCLWLLNVISMCFHAQTHIQHVQKRKLNSEAKCAVK